MKFNKFIMTAALGMAISIPAFAYGDWDPDEKWKPIGTGTLRDDILTTHYILKYNMEFPVLIEESEKTPGRYRLVDAYRQSPKFDTRQPDFPEDATNYIVVDASDPNRVWLEPGGASVWAGQDQHLLLWSIADDVINNGSTEAKPEEVAGKMVQGVITFPLNTLLTAFTDEAQLDNASFVPTAGYMWQKSNGGGMFRIMLPGVPQHDVEMEVIGINATEDGVEYRFTLDEPVDYALVAVFEGQYTEDMADKIKKGEVSTLKVDSSGVFTVPFTKDGIMTVVAVPYVGETPYIASYQTKQWAYSQKEWRKLTGKAIYTENFLASNYVGEYGGGQYSIEAYTYEVNVEQNVDDKAKFRLVDVYAPGNYPLSTEKDYQTDKIWYMEFDLSNPQCVMLGRTQCGYKFAGGYFELWGTATRRIEGGSQWLPKITMEQAMSDPTIPKITYDAQNRTVVFPMKSVMIAWPSVKNDWYEANNSSEKSKIVLPEDFENPDYSNVEGIVTEPEACETEYFTLDGMRVANPSAGIYIMRSNGETRKVLVK